MFSGGGGCHRNRRTFLVRDLVKGSAQGTSRQGIPLFDITPSTPLYVFTCHLFPKEKPLVTYCGQLERKVGETARTRLRHHRTFPLQLASLKLRQSQVEEEELYPRQSSWLDNSGSICDRDISFFLKALYDTMKLLLIDTPFAACTL
jgi:hypothetical protein